METIGIDIGATEIKIVGMDRRIIRSGKIKTPRSLAKFKAALAGVLEDFGARQARGIGAGVAAAVDPVKGLVMSAHNLPFLNDFKIKQFLAGYNRRVAIDNDVRCIAAAEMNFGAARGVKNAVVIAIGTGIGGGIIIDGKLYRGNASAGEIGYMILDHGKTFEALAGGRTLHSFSDAELKRVGKYLGLACANIINLLAPDKIILAGGVTERRYKKFMPQAAAAIKRHALWHAARHTKIVPSKLGTFAGAMGATLLV